MKARTVGMIVVALASTTSAQVAWIEVLPFDPIAVSGDGRSIIGNLPDGAGQIGFRWSRASGIEPISINNVHAAVVRINRDGSRILTRMSGSSRGYVWREGGPPLELLWHVTAWDMASTAERVVGYERTLPCAGRAALWGSDGLPVYLEPCSMTAPSEAAKVSPDGRRIVVRGPSNTFYIWVDGAPNASYPTGMDLAALADDGSLVGSITVGTTTFAVRSTPTFQLVNLGPIGEPPTRATAVTPDGSLIVCTEGWVWGAEFGLINLRTLMALEGLSFPSEDPIDILGVSHDRSVFIGTGGGLAAGAGWAVQIPPVCYANCDRSTAAPAINVADFTCFLQRFAAGESYANCDQSTAPPALNIADFTCFLQKFAAGCP